jgi:hypothetical protein
MKNPISQFQWRDTSFELADSLVTSATQHSLWRLQNLRFHVPSVSYGGKYVDKFWFRTEPMRVTTKCFLWSCLFVFDIFPMRRFLWKTGCVGETDGLTTYIHDVPGEKVNILGDHSIGHSKQKCICTYDLFRTVSEIELFHCTVPKLLMTKRYYALFLISVLLFKWQSWYFYLA